jgi:predicted ATPase
VQESFPDASLLLVLDNCEHVLSAMPEVGGLLAMCPGIKILATSREPLGLQWEFVYPVAPLALADPQRVYTAESVGVVPAVALFVQRARATEPAFELTDHNAAAVASICARLDGLPLAIELAAARVRLLAPAVLLSRLDSSLDVLKSAERDRPGRHQTLRAALDWSFNLLSPHERHALLQMAVFAGGCTLEAAEAVGIDFDALSSLADKSLVHRVEDEERFRLLETVREYALEQLDRDPRAADAARAAHAAFFLDLAERTESQLTSPELTTAFPDLEREWGNLQAALGWASDGGDAALSMRLAAALSAFGTRAHQRLGTSPGGWPMRALIWLERVLARDVEPPGRDRLKVLGATTPRRAHFWTRL